MFRPCNKSAFSLMILLSGVLAGFSVSAQQSDIEALRKNVDILSSVLSEGLGLSETPNPFSFGEGRVESVYLQGQGVMMEIQTQLARRRNRVSLNALASSIQDLQNRPNPFAPIERPEIASSSTTMAMALRENSVGEIYQDVIEEINSIDFSAIINNSIRQASSSARSLRELGELDQESFNDLRQELDSMRESMAERMGDLRELQNNLSDQSVAENEALDESAETSLRVNVEQMKLAMEQLKNSAAERALILNERYETARARYAEQWQGEVSNFENELYGLLCDYGATLRELPDDEYLTIVLKDLGAESEDKVRADKIHVLRKSDLARCQSGRIDSAGLQESSVSYSY